MLGDLYALIGTRTVSGFTLQHDVAVFPQYRQDDARQYYPAAHKAGNNSDLALNKRINHNVSCGYFHGL